MALWHHTRLFGSTWTTGTGGCWRGTARWGEPVPIPGESFTVLVPAQVRQEQTDPEGHPQLPVRGLHEPDCRVLHHRLTAAGVQAWGRALPGTFTLQALKSRGWNETGDPAMPTSISAPFCSATSASSLCAFPAARLCTPCTAPSCSSTWPGTTCQCFSRRCSPIW